MPSYGSTKGTWVAAYWIAIILAAGLLMPFGVLARSQPTFQLNSPGCGQQVSSGNLPTLTPAQESQALTLAQESVQFSNAVKGHSFSYRGISLSYSFDSKSCSGFAINAITVDFMLTDIDRPLAVYINPDITQVTGTSLMTVFPGMAGIPSSAGGDSPSPYWSGYRVYYQQNGQNTSEYYSLTNFNQPSVSSNSYCYNGQPYACGLSDWAGLHLDNFVAQTGTLAEILCDSSGSCNPVTYTGWWELVDGTTIIAGNNCPSTDTVSLGDYLQPIAQNGPIWGGTNTQYRTYLLDNSAGWVCSSGTQSTSYGPTNVADALLERPAVLGTDGYYYLAGLPTFGSILNYKNIECYGTGSGQCPYFYASTSNNWYTLEQMQNCQGSYNIVESGMDTTGNFTSTYQNSCGT